MVKGILEGWIDLFIHQLSEVHKERTILNALLVEHALNPPLMSPCDANVIDYYNSPVRDPVFVDMESVPLNDLNPCSIRKGPVVNRVIRVWFALNMHLLAGL